MKVSDCCGASPDGIDGCKDVGICPDCKEHCEWLEEDDEPIDLGWANGWKQTPALVKNCEEQRAAGFEHDYSDHTSGPESCVHRVECRTCGYLYRYDSGD